MAPAGQTKSQIGEWKRRGWDIALWVTYVFFFGCFTVCSVKAASKNPFWMDEVLTVWLLRMPSLSQIYSAIMVGAQSTTPTYPVLLHYYSKIAGQSHLALRLPSLLAVLITGVLSFVLIRRHLGTAPAMFASCLLMESLSPFGLQVRPYALVTVCFAAALLLWDDLNRKPSLWRVFFIGTLLAADVALHFYGVLLVPAFGFIEGLRMIRTRKLRAGLWIAMFLAGASVLVWLPLIHATRHLVGLDVTQSYAYGAMPTLGLLVSTYAYLFQGWGNLHLFFGLGMNGLILLVALGLLPLAAVLEKRFATLPSDNFPPAHAQTSGNDFWEILLGTLLAPAFIFVFAMSVTKSFNLRYVLVGAFGASALLAEVLGSFPAFRRALPAVLTVAGVFTLVWGAPSMELFDDTPLYHAIPGNAPIVEADGSQFFQLEEEAPAEFRSRLVYLVVPPRVPVGDAMNQDVIQRWKSVNPSLPVEFMPHFLATHREFYVLDQQTTDDTPAVYMYTLHLIDPWKMVAGAIIYRSHASWP